jgi:hypothetical protein
MTDQPLTIEQLFDLDFERPSDRQIARVQSSRAFKALRRRFKGTPALWPATANQVIQAFRQTLDVPIAIVLVRAWNLYQPFLKFLDQERYPQHVVNTVPLANHTVATTLRPYVTLLVDEKRLAEIHFELKVNLALEGAVLTIRGGRFMELRTGRCHVKIVLRCEDALLWEQSSRNYSFPGVLSFAEGIPIGPRGFSDRDQRESVVESSPPDS